MSKKKKVISFCIIAIIAVIILVGGLLKRFPHLPDEIGVETIESSDEKVVNDTKQEVTKLPDKSKGLEDLSGDDIEVSIKEVEEVLDIEEPITDYTCDIDWSNGELTSEEFTKVEAIAVKQYENKLNEEEAGRYTVVNQVLKPDDLKDSKYGLVYYWVDDIGVLYMQTKLAIYDSKEGTESIVVKVLPVAYSGNIITIYEE